MIVRITRLYIPSLKQIGLQTTTYSRYSSMYRLPEEVHPALLQNEYSLKFEKSNESNLDREFNLTRNFARKFQVTMRDENAAPDPPIIIDTPGEVAVESGSDLKTNLNIKNRKGTLLEAAEKGLFEQVKTLLDLGADVNQRDRYGRTALHLCLSEPKITRLLLNNGAAVNTMSRRGQTALHFAVSRDREQVVRVLLEFGADVNSQDHLGNTPLHRCYSGPIARLLMEHGAKVDAKNQVSKTPLHNACKYGTRIVPILLEYGADVHARTDMGMTPLHRVALAWVAKLLLNKGANLNAKTRNGTTPLQAALKSNTKPIISFLLKQGADVNVSSEYGTGSLNLTESIKIFKLLLIHGADANAQTNTGYTVICKAIDEGCIDTVTALLECGADPNTRTNSGYTPLFKAVYNGRIEIVEVLLKYGADVNALNKYNLTALHQAGSEAIAALLLDYGADLDIQTIDGYTALFNAILNGRDRVVSILLHYGADINSHDARGRTALGFAILSWKRMARVVDDDKKSNGPEREHSKFTEGIYETIVRNIEQHIVKLKVAGFHVSEENLEAVCLSMSRPNIGKVGRHDHNKLHIYDLECKEELQLLKGHKLNNIISLFDILHSKKATYLREKDSLIAMECIDFIQYPIYGPLLESKYKRDKRKLATSEEDKKNKVNKS